MWQVPWNQRDEFWKWRDRVKGGFWFRQGEEARRRGRPGVTPLQAPLGRWERPSAGKNDQWRGAVTGRRTTGLATSPQSHVKAVGTSGRPQGRDRVAPVHGERCDTGRDSPFPPEIGTNRIVCHYWGWPIVVWPRSRLILTI